MRTPYFIWYSLNAVEADMDKTVQRLNERGTRLEVWCAAPAVRGFVLRPIAVPFAATYTWQPGKTHQSLDFGALTANTTITLDGIALDDAAELTTYFVQNNVGGFTVTFAAATGYTVSWGTTGFVAMGATASKVTIYKFCFKGTTFHGWQVTKNS